MSYQPFVGDDLTVWLNQYKFSENMRKALEALEAKEVVDLVLIRENTALMTELANTISKLELTKFSKTLEVTTPTNSQVIETKKKNLSLTGKLGDSGMMSSGASVGTHTSTSLGQGDNNSVATDNLAAKGNLANGGRSATKPDTRHIKYGNILPPSSKPPLAPHPTNPSNPNSSAVPPNGGSSVAGSIGGGSLSSLSYTLPSSVFTAGAYNIPSHSITTPPSMEQRVKEAVDLKMVRVRHEHKEKERLERYKEKMSAVSISLGNKGGVDLLFCVDRRHSPSTVSLLVYLQQGGLEQLVKALTGIHPYVSVRMALVCVDAQGKVRGQGVQAGGRGAWTCEAAGLQSALRSLAAEMRGSSGVLAPPPLSPIIHSLKDAGGDGVGWNSPTRLLCYLGASAPSFAGSAQVFSNLLQRDLAAVKVSPLVLVGDVSGDALVAQVAARARALLLPVLTVGGGSGGSELESVYAKIPFEKASPTPVLSRTEKVVCYPLRPLPEGAGAVGKADEETRAEDGMALSAFPLSAPVTLQSTPRPFARTQQQQIVFRGRVRLDAGGLDGANIWGPLWQQGEGLDGLQEEVWGQAGRGSCGWEAPRVVLKGFVDKPGGTKWSNKTDYEKLLAGHRLGVYMAHKFNEWCRREAYAGERLSAPVTFTPICLLQLNERWPQQPYVLCEGEIVGAVEGGLAMYTNNVGVIGDGNPSSAGAAATEAAAEADFVDADSMDVDDVTDVETLTTTHNGSIGTNTTACACHDSVQAFVHFTFHASGGYCVLAGLRGRYVKGQASGRGGSDGGYVLTTPVVHSRDVYSYHKTNLGTNGMDMVMRAHKCNAICRKLGLPEYAPGHLGDASTSVEWFSKAASQGNSDAQYRLAELYFKKHEDNGGIFKRKAFTWYERAAMQSHDDAMYMLGVCYRRGLGVEKSFGKALFWFAKAASLDNKEAIATLESLEKSTDAEELYLLGMCWLTGESVVCIDKAKAAELFRKSAQEGYEAAIIELRASLRIQLVQVDTGEGKSIILGALSVFFALLSFEASRRAVSDERRLKTKSSTMKRSFLLAIIKKAATVGQVKLAAKAFGRGPDFFRATRSKLDEYDDGMFNLDSEGSLSGLQFGFGLISRNATELARRRQGMLDFFYTTLAPDLQHPRWSGTYPLLPFASTIMRDVETAMKAIRNK
eukprot:gene26564-32105_t